MRLVLIIASNLVTFIAAVPYLRDTMTRKTKPRLASWIAWTALTGIGALASFAQHQYPTAIFNILCSLECLAIVLVGLKTGDRKLEKLDKVCLGGAIVGVVSLVVLRSPSLAVLVVIATDFTGGIPTLKHAWRRPGEETVLKYALEAVGAMLILFVTGFHALTGFGYPLYIFLMDLTIVALIYIRKTNLLASVFPNGTTAAVAAGEPVVVSAAAPSVPKPAIPAVSAKGSPARVAELTWSTVAGASSYVVYRDGAKAATVSTPYFADTYVPEGPHSYTVSAVNGSGESDQSMAVEIIIDPKSPVLGELTWTSNPVAIGVTTTLVVPIIEQASGIAEAEYFFGDDPGPGQGKPLLCDETQLMTGFTSLYKGTFKVGVRAKDAGGSWSSVVYSTLDVG